MSFIIIDTANMFWRAIAFNSKGTFNDRSGLTLHIMFRSIQQAWKKFNGSHVVFAFEGRSWRKDYLPQYKSNRKIDQSKLSVKEIEESKILWEIFDRFKEFVTKQTNCTVLHHPQLEADDLIAGWIKHHPADQHVILSTDGDFAQLISDNVVQYNGVSNITTTINGYFDDWSKPVIDNKTKKPKSPPDPEWLLFVKCMRGDTSDNVFSAYPGVRTKGSKNKVGLTEAYDDRKLKGYNWNNLMLQRWIDHNGVEHQVINDYQRNVVLCDLSAQPDPIKNIIKETIENSCKYPKQLSQVGVRVLKFCSSYDLTRITDNIQTYSEPFAAQYVQQKDQVNVETT